MSQTLELMRRRISTAEDLYGVVRVMKALAASSVRQYEAAVESLAEYNRTIEEGLQVALRNRPESILPETVGGNRQAVIVFGSDQGMCGAFNEQIVTFTLERLDALDDELGDIEVLAVGARVVGRLEDAGCQVVQRLLMPSSIAGITPAVHKLLLAVEALRFAGGIDRLQVIHHRPGAHASSRPQILQLLPVDRAWLDRLAARDWDSRSLPTFSMKWRTLFSSLIRQHLFVALYRAFAESLASENASRLSSMQAAERNIQGHLEQLALDYHQGRQESIQAELLDIVAGFETLMEDSAQTDRVG
ncbi:F0F1 ATP synthase subunit gamma [Nitrosomonas sp. HPC101]|uniref:F0F1 ATP synthase subunit gamma n=1 Tax=Nitrosomonas sp. HPC101 TaxID=1658667 RepID=UPI00136B2FE0|nr:F0F1 ATP synthase subunit gamma [Nitrosomonas sp. HPC101]MXS85493.1 F0F1 ATP synthase subunit gamma [Nitrosomonas sp. HPC101]